MNAYRMFFVAVMALLVMGSAAVVEGASDMSLADAPQPGEVGYVFSDEYFEYEVTDDLVPAVTITGLAGEHHSSYTVPASVTDAAHTYAVNDIGADVFSGDSEVISVVFAAGSPVTSIPGSAFEGCANLVKVVLPDALTSIESRAFAGCVSLVTITIPSGTTSIKTRAFEGDLALREVVNLSGLPITAGGSSQGMVAANASRVVTSVGESLCSFHEKAGSIYVFENDNLLVGFAGSFDGTLILPAEIDSISNYGIDAISFISYPEIDAFAIDGMNSAVTVTDGIIYSADGTVLIAFPASRAVELITVSVTGTVPGISEFACFTVPDSVTRVADFAFYGSGLELIYMPSVAAVGPYAVDTGIDDDVHIVNAAGLVVEDSVYGAGTGDCGNSIYYVFTFENPEGAVIAQQFYHIGGVVTAPVVPSAPGYSSSWSPAPPSIAVFADEQTFVPAPEDYTVTFVTNGGSAVAPIAFTVESPGILLPDSEKTGYDFLGWFDNPSLEGTAITDIPSGTIGDITLYAAWSPTDYPITYNMNGGRNSPANPATYTILDSIVFADPLVRAGYTFEGWYTDAEFEHAITSVSAGTTGALVLYAKWSAGSFTITYYLDGGTNNPANPDNFTPESGDIVLEDPSKTGYDFCGWYLDVMFEEQIDVIPSGTSLSVTLYAKWEIHVYSVDYVLDEGTNNPANPGSYVVTDSEIVFADPVKAGYSFEGWYADAEFEHVITNIPAGSTGDVTVYAKWAGLPYVVSFVANGGEGSIAPCSYVCGDGGLLPACTFTNGGRAFLGWSDSASGEVIYSDRAVATFIPSVSGYSFILYAVWGDRGIVVNVTVDGAGAPGQAVSVTGDSGTIALSDRGDGSYYAAVPIDAGDYAVTVNGTGVAEITVTDNVVNVPADFFTVTFTNTYGDPVDPAVVLSGSAVADPGTPSRAGYDFICWTVDGEEYDFDTPVTSTMEVSASWEIVTYSITYVLDGGSGDPSDPVTYTVEDADIAFSPATRTGYDFGGWVDEEDNPVTGIVHGSTGDVTVYAVWDAHVYTVSYVLNGGRNSAHNPATYTIADDDIFLAAAVKIGFAFDGWYLDAELTDPVEVIESGSTGDITVYAGWADKVSNIFYVLNGGTNSPENPDSYRVSETVVLAPATRDGYDFDSWYLDEELTNPVAVVGNSVGDVTLYAGWSAPVTYTISYVLNGGTNNPGNITSYNVESPDFELLDAVREYYDFTGWFSDSELTEQVTVIATGSFGDITLYAGFTPTEYVINYELDGGTNSPENPATYTYFDAGIVFAEPSKNGYTFTGWFSDEALTVPTTGIASGSSGEVTVYAGWVLDTHTITYEANGGTVPAGNPVEYNVEQDVPLIDSEKEGYTFCGWFEDAGFAGEPVTNVSELHGDTVLYAKWEVVSYEITYELDGGTNSPANPATYSIESPAIIFATASREGYTFAGWFSDEALTISTTGIEAGSTGDVTVYAKWTSVEYAIIYVLDGGTNSPDNPATYFTGDEVTFAVPTKASYDFAGWFSDAEFTAAVEGITAGEYGNVTVYAKWTPHVYSISYVLNGGTESGNPVEYTVESDAIVFTDAVRTGYTFTGWYTDAGCTVRTEGIPAGSSGNVTVYAGWDAIDYRITYRLDDGENSPENPATYTIEDGVVFADPSKSGYSFDGWFSDAAFTTKVTAIVAGTTGDMTLYAKWSIITYAITYVANGGEYPEDNPVSYTVEDSLSIGAASKEGSVFGGWFSDEACTVPMDEIVPGTTGDLTLYAKFTEESNTFLIIGLIGALVVIIAIVAFLLNRNGYFNKEW